MAYSSEAFHHHWNTHERTADLLNNPDRAKIVAALQEAAEHIRVGGQKKTVHHLITQAGHVLSRWKCVNDPKDIWQVLHSMNSDESHVITFAGIEGVSPRVD